MTRIPLIIDAEPDDPEDVIVLVDGTVAGRPYRFVLDTGAWRSQLEADEYTCSLEAKPGEGSSGVFAPSSDPVVTVRDVAVGPLRAETLDVWRAEPVPPHPRNLLGMDVLSQYRCLLRLGAAASLDINPPPDHQARHDLLIGDRGHVYLDVSWPGVTAQACVDTGASITIVNRDFRLAHPQLFEDIGTTTGTDTTGTTFETPLVLLAEAVIGDRPFARHKAAVVDLSHIGTDEPPTDLILGFPTLCQADWLFDFPAKRWAVMNPTAR